MGHRVRGFVGARPILELIQSRYEQSRVVDLEQLLTLLPLTDELYQAIPDGVTGTAEKGFARLTPKIVDLLKEISTYGVIGYFETDYFGGGGNQGAILARLDQVTFGPQVGPNSINQMLELLGARRKTSDAYDAMGLGRHRSTDDWLAPTPERISMDTVTMTGKFISWVHGFGKK